MHYVALLRPLLIYLVTCFLATYSFAQSGLDNLDILIDPQLKGSYGLNYIKGRSVQITKKTDYRSTLYDNEVAQVSNGYISATPCFSNKEKFCIGNLDTSTNRGIFRMYQYTKDNKSELIQISCDAKDFEKSKNKKLTSCRSYSKSKCDKWEQYKSTNPYYKSYSNLSLKAKECIDIVNALNNVRAQLNNTFSTSPSERDDSQRTLEKMASFNQSLLTQLTTKSDTHLASYAPDSLADRSEEINRVNYECGKLNKIDETMTQNKEVSSGYNSRAGQTGKTNPDNTAK